MIIIFEDKKDTPSSVLLSSSVIGDKIRFSGGAPNMQKAILKELNNSKESILAYYDVSLDNIDTLDRFQNLCTTFSDNERVEVIPIPCIEYYLIKLLDYYDLVKDRFYYEKSSITFDYKSFIDTKFGSEPGSVEEFYKILCKKTGYSCCVNRNDKNKSHIGKFYREDCDCIEMCKKTKISQRDKSLNLIKYLPCFIITEELKEEFRLHNINYTKVGIEDIKGKQRKLYLKMERDLQLDIGKII